MNLREAYLRASVETKEQFEAVCGRVDIVYIDSAFFDALSFEGMVNRAHASDTLIGLRSPYIWRDKSEDYFDGNPSAGKQNDTVIKLIKDAGFDAYLFRNTESMLYFAEHGLTEDKAFATDSSMYVFNGEAVAELSAYIPDNIRKNHVSFTLPSELNGRELESLSKTVRAKFQVNENAPGLELVVYGRVPMMVSAQCINKTVHGCDKQEKLLMLKDRKDAEMPVKNCCRFCYNLIYNAVPTMLYDMPEVRERIKPDAIRYDFTTENAGEVIDILKGIPLKAGGFTRGHLKRGV